MKKLLAFVLVCAPAFAAEQMVTSAAPAEVAPIVCGGTDASSYGSFTSSLASKVYPIGDAYTTSIHVYSAAGSVATVAIDVAPTTTGPWYTVATVTNPSATGEPWSVPRYRYCRINVTYTSGTVKACISAWKDGKQVY